MGNISGTTSLERSPNPTHRKLQSVAAFERWCLKCKMTIWRQSKDRASERGWEEGGGIGRFAHLQKGMMCIADSFSMRHYMSDPFFKQVCTSLCFAYALPPTKEEANSSLHQDNSKEEPAVLTSKFRRNFFSQVGIFYAAVMQ
nr:hypothetical protein HmN_000302400 [Hymenolepis microstoma]